MRRTEHRWSDITQAQANELQDVLHTLTSSGAALLTSARELVARMERAESALQQARREALEKIVRVLGPTAGCGSSTHCDGCLTEMQIALQTAKDALAPASVPEQEQPNEIALLIGELDGCYSRDRVGHENAQEIERIFDRLRELTGYVPATSSPDTLSQLRRWTRSRGRRALTTDEIAALRKLEQAATKGPWRVRVLPNLPCGDALVIDTDWDHGQLDGPISVVSVGIGLGPHRETIWMTRDDAELIAAMRNALPSLLADSEILARAAGERFNALALQALAAQQGKE